MKREKCAHSVDMIAGLYGISNSRVEPYVSVPVLCVYAMLKRAHKLSLKSFWWSVQQKVYSSSYKTAKRIPHVDDSFSLPALRMPQSKPARVG